MVVKDERVKTRLEQIQKMTGDYKSYLQRYDYGGDWDMPSFMKAIETKAKEIEELLEKEQGDGN